MNKTLTWFAFAVAVLGMGISMPSCPGQQAMEQKIEGLEKSDGDIKKTLQSIDSSVKTMSADMGAVRGQLASMATDTQAVRTRVDQLEAAVKELQAKAAAPAPKSKPAGKKHK